MLVDMQMDEHEQTLIAKFSEESEARECLRTVAAELHKEGGLLKSIEGNVKSYWTCFSYFTIGADGDIDAVADLLLAMYGGLA